jgi:hypothetical protein
MEKKGELLNQLAIISDLIEKLNLNKESATLIIEQKKEDFEKSFIEVQKKYGIKTDKPDNTFEITIGFVDIIFNTNNV